MSDKKLATLLLGLSLLLFFGFVVSEVTSEPKSLPSGLSPQSNTEQTNGATEQSFTTTQVKQHNTESDCWTIISGNVYDLTAYIPRHMGGDEILRACGSDATTLYTQRRTDSGETVGSGTPHSSSAENLLSSFLKGKLKD